MRRRGLVLDQRRVDVALGTETGAVELVDVADPGDPQPLGEPLTDIMAMIESVAFSPDDTMLAVGGSDRIVTLWDVNDPGRPATVAVLGSDGRVDTVAFRPGERTLIGGGEASTLPLWSTDVEVSIDDMCRRSGDGITRDEWARFLPGLDYVPPCGLSQ